MLGAWGLPSGPCVARWAPGRSALHLQRPGTPPGTPSRTRRRVPLPLALRQARPSLMQLLPLAAAARGSAEPIANQLCSAPLLHSPAAAGPPRRARRPRCRRAALPARPPCPRWWPTLCSSCTATSGSATSTRCLSCPGAGWGGAGRVRGGACREVHAAAAGTCTLPPPRGACARCTRLLPPGCGAAPGLLAGHPTSPSLAPCTLHPARSHTFPHLSERFFKGATWPPVEAVLHLVDGDHVFGLLYKEMYYR